MPSYFPCPNTQCSYQFDAEILPPAALVTCPLCRTKFPYRADRPAPGSAAADGAAPDGPRVVNIRDVPHGGGPLVVIAWIAGTVAVLGTLVAVLVVWSGKQSGFVSRGDENGDATDAKFNLRLAAFPSEYSEDVAAREALGANIYARRRTDPDGWVAMAARDFKDRNPREAELDEFVNARLRGAVTTPTIVEGDAEQTWAGRPARAFAFGGDWDGTQVKGQALAISYQGFGYVFFAWAPERDWDGLRGELLGLREKFSFLSPRSDWATKVAATTTFAGPGFEIADPDGAWVLGRPADQWKPKEQPRYVVDNPQDEDPAALMLLRAAYQSGAGGDGRRHPAVAYAMVAELTTGGNPLDVAKEHVTERIKREFAGTNAEVKLEAAPGGAALPAGGPAIGRFRFRSPLAKDDRVLWIVSAISVGGKVVAVEIKVKEKDAAYVEEWMVHLAGSLKAR